MNKSQVKRHPHRFKINKPLYKNKYFWLCLFGFIIGSAVLRFFLFSDFFQVKNIQISGNVKISAGDLENMVNNRVQNNILFFPTKNIFFVSQKKIENEILNNYPIINTADLTKKMPGTLTLAVKERIAEAVFYSDELYYLIDKQGIIFEPVSGIDPNYLEIENLIPINEVRLGNKVVNESEMAKIFEIETALKNDIKIPIQKASIISNERLNIKTFAGWDIYFNTGNEISWQIKMLKLALEKQISQEKQNNLEYIDLRFGNQIFFR
ncbi:MAG: FtsQ-type POTRA domain-containing protein [Candidatus Parcubacteria bacterium]|nr:FtsQ-type POTRA domain-containing protein [Candidatus Parcubacteria bacterium]